MLISAPYLEIGAPKFGKNARLGTNSVCVTFPVFWLVHSISEVLSACKILDGGVTPFPRYGEKTGLMQCALCAMRILDRTLAKLQSLPAAVELTRVSHFTCCS